VLGNPGRFLQVYPGCAGHPDGFLQVNSSCAGHPDGFLQGNPGCAGHPDGFLQVYPGCAGHPDGFLQVKLDEITTGKKEQSSGCRLEHKTQNTTHIDTTTNKMSRATLPSSGFAPSLSMDRAVAPPNHGATTPQRHAQAATRQGCACCVFDLYLFFLPVVIFSGRTIWCSYFDTYSN
jgi:hypothetical protein